jgi:spore maturation protein CgeB
MTAPLRIVVLGLSLSSSWGNGHATTYRALLGGLARRGHDIVFLERDVPWYAAHRDHDDGSPVGLFLYRSLPELMDVHLETVRHADVVVVGSYVPDGIAVGDWIVSEAGGIKAFYDIDTPVTLAAVEQGRCDYLRADQIARYDLYLSFTGGPTLRRLESTFGSPMARALYCCVDPQRYRPHGGVPCFDLGYMGTYSADRQPGLDELLLSPARASPGRRFVVAGPQYPETIQWPANVDRIEHLGPDRHPSFYASQRLTLNLTRADMVRAGWSPSVRLFEAAACATPVISDHWAGLADLFEPGREILLASSAAEVVRALAASDIDIQAIGQRARRRVLAEHTADHRAADFDACLLGACRTGRRRQPREGRDDRGAGVLERAQ